LHHLAVDSTHPSSVGDFVVGLAEGMLVGAFVGAFVGADEVGAGVVVTEQSEYVNADAEVPDHETLPVV
jgi:hypothetical protein